MARSDPHENIHAFISETDPEQVDEYLASRKTKAARLFRLLSGLGVVSSDQVVLAPGCSFGEYEAEFQRLSDVRLVASDLDVKAVTRFAQSNIEKVVCDLARLSYADEAFDLVLLPMVLEHVKEYELAFGEVRRVLKPGGVLYIHVPNPVSLVCPQFFPSALGNLDARRTSRLVYRYYRNKLRPDYLRNRVEYHAGYTKKELKRFLPGYTIQHIFWERVLSDHPDSVSLKLIVNALRRLPGVVRSVLEVETFLLARKPL